MVTEDRERLGRNRTGRNMKNRRGQLAGDLEHVRDHQQQALRCGKGGAQRTCLQCTVNSTGGAAFRLHFNDFRDGAPDVLFSGSALGVGDFTHH